MMPRAIEPVRYCRGIVGFSLLELLVSCVIFALVLATILSVVNHTTQLWQQSNSRVDAFQNARRAFDVLTQALSQATLNTYLDYDDPNSPKRYLRRSELHFLIAPASEVLPTLSGVTGWSIFFQTPARRSADSVARGLEGLINACGFFVQFGTNADWLPSHLDVATAKPRFRLMQWIQNTESLQIYSQPSREWIRLSDDIAPVADNIITLVFWPREGFENSPGMLPDALSYDSRAGSNNSPQPVTANQFPPLVEVLMVAIDEASAGRLGEQLQATIEECSAGLFLPSSSPGESFEANLATLEAELTKRKINYRVFRSSIPIREAKWSVDQ